MAGERLVGLRAAGGRHEHLGIDTDATVLPAGRALLLSSDFYAVYQSVGTIDGVDNLWCWTHIRRYLIRTGHTHPAQLGLWAQAWVDRIGALYAASGRRDSVQGLCR